MITGTICTGSVRPKFATVLLLLTRFVSSNLNTRLEKR